MRYHELVENNLNDERLGRIKEQMRSNNLSENATNEFLNGLAAIKKDCQSYINQTEYMFGMLRGMNIKHTDPLILTKTAHLTERNPKDTHIRFHEALNKFFNKKFGHPFRNGVFVTSNSYEAAEYGNEIYAIFPIGNFDFLWSPDVKDLTMTFGLAPAIFKEEDFKEKMKEIMLANWKTNNLNAAMKSHHEIMLWTPKYYAINMFHLMYDKEFLKNVREYLKS